MTDREFLLREQARRTLARKSFHWYLRYVHGAAWKRTRLAEFLAGEIQTFVEEDTGHPYDILILQTPPQHGKSMTVTESFPSWYLGRNPENRVIAASYNEETARRFGRRNQEKLEQVGGPLFGVGKGGVWTSTEFELDNGWGRMISRGIMSGITGNPANLMLIDDPIKNREEADSEVFREKLWNEWQSTLKSRLAAGAKVVVIATPWHEDDLMARIARFEPNVKVLRLPVEAEENDPMGRPVGAPLAPELGKDGAWLAQFKAGYLADPRKGGLRAWQALFQCAPRVEGGNLVDRKWWRWYDPEEVKGFPTTVLSVDAAFKDSADSDFVAVEVWSKRDNDYYLRYSLNQRLSFPATLQTIRTVRSLFPDIRYTLVEDKANGSAIIQTLQSELIGVIPVEPRGGKVARVHAVSPAIESGHVYLPREKLFAQELVEQFSAFPGGRHDDLVDAATQALSFLLYARGAATQVPQRNREEVAFLGEEAYRVYGRG